MERICNLLKQYKINMDSQKELNDSLLTMLAKEAWLDYLKERSVRMQKINAENVLLLEAIETILAAPLTEESAGILYKEVYQMYWDGYDDSQLLLPMIAKLIDFYESNENLPRLIFLYSAAYYEESEVQNRSLGLKLPADGYNHKIIRYRSRYTEITDESTRRRIWSAYYNLIVISLANQAIDADTSYHYFKEAMDFWNTPEVQALDGSNLRTVRVVERIRKEWLIVSEYIDGSSSDTISAFCQLAEEAYQKELQHIDNPLEAHSEVYSAYLHSLVLQGKQNFDHIIDKFYDYSSRKFPLCNFDHLSDDDLYFIINAPLTLEEWVQHTDSEHKAKKIISDLQKLTQDTWYYKLNKHSSPFVNETLADWCFRVMKYIDTPDQKEEWLFQLLIRRQLPTYLHSVMVAHLAEVLSKELLLKEPQLLANVPLPQEDDLLSFIRQCALLHDIGKTRITDIVNTQGRRLRDIEFEAIRQHPAYGAQMIQQDPDLNRYHDIILGHHKFYNGKGGYPETFDNTASPYRTIIDLITICDCIDAATDHLGRNYRTAKTLEQVLDELAAGKGTRYNPDLVDFILNSTDLQDKLRYFVTDGRLDIMYEAYSESTAS